MNTPTITDNSASQQLKSSVVGDNHNSLSGYSIASDYLYDLQEDQKNLKDQELEDALNGKRY